MPRSVDNSVLDAALNNLADNGDELHLCTQEPTTFTEATSTYTVGNTALTTGAGNGDWSTIADGDTSGRKITLQAQTGISINTDGTVDHAAVVDTVNSILKYVFVVSSQGVTSGGTADTSASDVELEDPTA